MEADLWSLYHLMLRSRLLEEAVARLWHEGLISGEMHLGTGEEGVIAGVVSQLRDGDSMALDHRGTAAFLMRGVDPVPILREMLGREDGLCRGMGGHMHLFSKEHLAASSGIVGAEGPAAVGFALSAQYLKTGSVSVAFFGDGAVNQGMLMESMNLASAWKLPVLFVCKDDGWAITTQSKRVTGGDLKARAAGFGIPYASADGSNVREVWKAAAEAISRARSGAGPTFLHATCVHFEAHFLGFQLLRIARHPFTEVAAIAVPLTRSFLRPRGGGVGERLAGLREVLAAVVATLRDPRGDAGSDPVRRARMELESNPARLREIEEELEAEVADLVSSAMVEVAP